MLDCLGYKGPNRTALHTLAAGDTHRFFERLVSESTDFKIIASVGHFDGVHPDNFATCPHTYATLNAFVGIEIEEGIAGVHGEILGHPV
jgi:hypothetical protein